MRYRLITILLVIALGAPLVAWASEVAVAPIVVPAGETVNDNFVRVGGAITIEGAIHGDVMVACQTLTISGVVDGDVLAAAQTIRIDGTINGSLRAAAMTIDINGAIQKNATLAAQTISFGSKTAVGWSVQAFGSTFDVAGSVKGNLNYYGQTATVSAVIGGNATMQLGERGQLTLTTPTNVGKNLTYYSTQQAAIASGVIVGGMVEQRAPAVDASDVRAWFATISTYVRFVSLVGWVIIGIILVAAFPATGRRVVETIEKRWWPSSGAGIIAALLVPIAATLFFITIVGIPLGMLIFAAYGLLLTFAKIAVSLVVGTWILRLVHVGTSKKNSLLAVIVGVIIFTVLTWIPWIGWLIALLGVLPGIGGLLIVAKERHRACESV